MNYAKLRRSRDVSKPLRVSCGNTFQIGNLAMLNMVIWVNPNGQESAHQPADLIAKSPICGRATAIQARHISSGRHPTACLRCGGFAL
jgi:hypothetical protein